MISYEVNLHPKKYFLTSFNETKSNFFNDINVDLGNCIERIAPWISWPDFGGSNEQARFFCTEFGLYTGDKEAYDFGEVSDPEILGN